MENVTTYRQLAKELAKLTSTQLDSTITVIDRCEEEAFPADFRICNEHHDSLDNGHPVIYF